MITTFLGEMMWYQYLLVLLSSFIVGMLIGWITRSENGKDEES